MGAIVSAWDASDVPADLLAMRPSISERKLRLFLGTCCRAAWDARLAESRNPRNRGEAQSAAVDERTDGTRAGARGDRGATHHTSVRCSFPANVTGGEPAAAQESQEDENTSPPLTVAPDTGLRLSGVEHRDAIIQVAVELVGAPLAAAVLREVLANPERSVEVDPAWLTTDVRLLAEGIYASRDFEWLPILADALQDAGCDSEDMLTHCRDTSHSHARGCWVIDLLLGRE